MARNKMVLLCSLLCALCSFVTLSCDNILNKPETKGPENGYGKVSVNVIGGNNAALNKARTVFPSLSTDYLRFEYTFTDTVSHAATDGLEPDKDGFFTLELGTYKVQVDAYRDVADVETLVASGTSDEFTVGSDGIEKVEVSLVPNSDNSGEQGEFEYTIIVPADAEIIISLQEWPGTVFETLAPQDTTEGNGKTQQLSLDAGLYLLTVFVGKDDTFAGVTEFVYIYPLLVTTFEKDFSKDGDLIDSDTVDILAITGIKPEVGVVPADTIDETDQFTGTVEWFDSDDNLLTAGTLFAPATVYKAVITLTAKIGYTLQGVLADAFTVDGEDETTNAANSGVINVTFLATTNRIYVITGSGTTFTATTGGVTIDNGTGTIQNVINAIRTNIDEEDCIVQFGEANAVTALDIGAASADFNNTGGTWGAVKLTGKITGSVATTTTGTIAIANAVSIISIADITNTAADANARAIYNNSTGPLTISGGTVSADMGVAVYNASTGTITVKGMATVTSANVTATSGTIHIASGGSGGSGGNRLVIEGGTVENIANNNSARAIYNASSGAVTVSGGTVQATGSNGFAVYNNSTGAVTISGGEVSATGSSGYAVNNGYTGTVTISGGTVSADTGYAVFIGSSGTVTISGGTVSATTGVAVHNSGTGKITVSQPTATPTLVTSANTSTSQGTVYFTRYSGDATEVRLEITGGTIRNTSTGANGNAIYNDSAGAVTISGGTVSTTATSGRAINNNHIGAVTISGGTVQATTGVAVRNDSTGAVTVSGGTVQATGSNGFAVYNSSTGAVTISGGTVSATSGRAVLNGSTGAVTISGGTVQARYGIAVSNYSTGIITVTQSQPTATLVTSANASSSEGTIYQANTSTAVSGVRINIQEGTVANTASNGYAIYNAGGDANNSWIQIAEPPAVITGNKYGCPP